MKPMKIYLLIWDHRMNAVKSEEDYTEIEENFTNVS